MNTEFIVTSTINAKFSIFDPDARFDQTLETIKSIRDHVPNAKINILESSVEELPKEKRDELIHLSDRFINFGKDNTVIDISSKLLSQDVIKNMTELVIINKFLNLSMKNNWFNGIDRLFKISGRYRLNDKFSLMSHDTGFTVGPIYKSQFPKETTGNIDQQYMLRLYSLKTDEIDNFTFLTKQMIEYMAKRLSFGGYADIEHLFYHFLPNDKTKSITISGVEGFIAPSGKWISE